LAPFLDIFFTNTSGFQGEASFYRKKVSSELVAKESEVRSLEEVNEKLIAKLTKLKEERSALQDTIKEHQGIRDELEKKLQQETKISQGLPKP
jgi:septal ring factor EnvC (AmiA/AmiB activator)